MVDYHQENIHSIPRENQISKENINEQEKRKKCEQVVNLLIQSIETHNYHKLESVLEPKAVLNKQNTEIIGRLLIQEYLEEEYKDIEIHLNLIRVLIDLEQLHVACEFYTRRKNFKTDNGYIENMSAWYFKLGEDFTVKAWYIWIDTLYKRIIQSLEEQLPQELWKPKPNDTYTQQEMSEIIEKKIDLFVKGEIEEWSNLLHDEIIIRPPWDIVCRKENCIKGAEAFFKNYERTKISTIEVLHDDQNPNQCVYLQIFSCHNKETGETGEDIDFIFIEVVDGKVRYWRSYYNTNNSALAYQNTFKFFIESIKNDKANK
ncbi:hypothetical protein DLAC_01149 [Tieghemostelium lacteum]|uniref:Uncharacterized protein n=1 Tax=Tieghemostelium lacteum TaxID=361077 RepID=A0A152A8C3_TIELA|nr:hypothetical protein DLAC_01149 [Tieghemostelium lacteum]|eukprot:KYR02317.1 hypothetical protein DLAC_01149 [Tieghemostelium lacteum]